MIHHLGIHRVYGFDSYPSVPSSSHPKVADRLTVFHFFEVTNSGVPQTVYWKYRTNCPGFELNSLTRPGTLVLSLEVELPQGVEGTFPSGCFCLGR